MSTTSRSQSGQGILGNKQKNSEVINGTLLASSPRSSIDFGADQHNQIKSVDNL